MNEFVSLNSCDLFTKMNQQELEELKKQLFDYQLDYRSNLGFHHDVTFGIEIEAEYQQKREYPYELIPFLQKNWRLDSESTLENGDEIISPILRDEISSWNDLKQVIEIMKQYYEIHQTCGGHIHIGTQILGETKLNWQNFCKLWSAYEKVIYRFTDGEYLKTRMYGCNYAKPLAKAIQYYKKDNHYNMQGLFSKDKAVSFKKVKSFQEEKNNTIEFRCPNGTLEATIWQNNINFFVRFLNYCKDYNFDYDTVDKREREITDYKNYHSIYFEEALELADLIFYNNLDKVNFLRQYLKDGTISDRCEKAKVFMKK